MHIQRISVITLYQHYFTADGEQLFGEEWERVGERVGEELLRGMGRWVESYGIESYGVESGANKKRASKISLQSSHIKEGGDLLSRIALQYHRRRRA